MKQIDLGTVEVSWFLSPSNIKCVDIIIIHYKKSNSESFDDMKTIYNISTTKEKIHIENTNITYVFKVQAYFNEYSSNIESQEQEFKISKEYHDFVDR